MIIQDETLNKVVGVSNDALVIAHGVESKIQQGKMFLYSQIDIKDNNEARLIIL